MLNYVVVYLLRVKYGLDVYISKEIVRKLEQFFTDVSSLPVAEIELCGYGRFYKELQSGISNKTRDYYMEEVNKRRNTPSWGLASTSEQSEADSILNSKPYFEQKVDMNNQDLIGWSSFPWEEYDKDFTHLENKDIQFGRAFILYPFGLTLDKLDGLFGRYLNHHLEDIPGILDFTLNSFVFKKKFRETSQKILTSIAQEFRKQNPKKFKRRQDITFVGVHHRRGDHIALQRESNLLQLGPGYFLNSMVSFREKYKRVVFVYVSDDMKWAEEKLLPRLKTKDFFLAGLLQVFIHFFITWINFPQRSLE